MAAAAVPQEYFEITVIRQEGNESKILNVVCMYKSGRTYTTSMCSGPAVFMKKDGELYLGVERPGRYPNPVPFFKLLANDKFLFSEEGNGWGFDFKERDASPRLAEALRTYLNSRVKGEGVTPIVDSVGFYSPDFKLVAGNLYGESRSSAKGLATVSAMWGSQAQPGASNAANPGAGDGSAAPLRLPHDVVRGPLANLLGLKMKKGGKSRRKKRTTRRRRVHKRGNTKRF
jgi:hypothetical protein